MRAKTGEIGAGRRRQLRLVGLGTWVVVGLPVLIAVAREPGVIGRWWIAAWLAAFAVFGAAYAVFAWGDPRALGRRRALVLALSASGLVANWLIPTPMPNIAIGGVLLVTSAAAGAEVFSARGTAALVGVQTAGMLAAYLAAWPWAYAALGSAAYLAFQVFACGTAMLARSEAEARRDLAASLASLRATQGMLAQSAALAERARIDRELHDALGHNLVVLSLNLQAAAAACDAGSARAGELVRGCHGLSRLILSDLRAMVREGREVATVDLRGAVERLAASAPGLAVRAEVGPEVEGLDVARAHALFRCGQEFLTNTLKHGAATEATLEIVRENGWVVLRAADNGRGASGVSEGAGLAGVRERLEELGGKAEFETSPGRGFRMKASLPAAGGAA